MKQAFSRAPMDSIGLMGHVVCGYPSFKECEEIVDVMVEAGVEVIELQFPFSEPMADGPTILAANHAALRAGSTIDQCFAFLEKATAKHPVAFLIMTYGNIVHACGYAAFCQRARQAGAVGAIIPDLSFDTAPTLFECAQSTDFALIPTIPPNMPDQRLQDVLSHASGFCYAVARVGVTGKRTTLDRSVDQFIGRLRQATPLPLAVGFGISSPEDVAHLVGKADYAVIGSRAIQVYDQGLSELKKFWSSLL